MMETVSRPLSQQQNPNRFEPIGKPRLDLLEKDEVKTKRPSLWNNVFYNDDYTMLIRLTPKSTRFSDSLSVP